MDTVTDGQTHGQTHKSTQMENTCFHKHSHTNTHKHMLRAEERWLESPYERRDRDMEGGREKRDVDNKFKEWTLNRSPCVRSRRPRVCRHHARPQHHTETETEKEDREKKQRKRRRKRIRPDKRREKIHFQCGGAWPFFVDGVLFLVNPVCARDLCLLSSVKYDSSLISFSASWPVNSFFNFCELIILCSYSFQSYFLNYLLVLQFRIFSKLFSYVATVFFARIISA